MHQALLHIYETFELSTGHTVKLPMDRGEGQQWNAAPGNLYSTVQTLSVGPGRPEKVHGLSLSLSEVIPPIEPPVDTEFVKHISIKSEMLSEFWGQSPTRSGLRRAILLSPEPVLSSLWPSSLTRWGVRAGREMRLGAHVLFPKGFDTHPDAKYPLALFHGHFPADFEGFRPEPPEEELEPDLATRFALPIPGVSTANSARA